MEFALHRWLMLYICSGSYIVLIQHAIPVYIYRYRVILWKVLTTQVVSTVNSYSKTVLDHQRFCQHLFRIYLRRSTNILILFRDVCRPKLYESDDNGAVGIQYAMDKS